MERSKETIKMIRKAFDEMKWAIQQHQDYAKELELELTKLKLEKEMRKMKENNND